jgi:glutathione gamma-glutamylcysteinyltransferase
MAAPSSKALCLRYSMSRPPIIIRRRLGCSFYSGSRRILLPYPIASNDKTISISSAAGQPKSLAVCSRSNSRRRDASLSTLASDPHDDDEYDYDEDHDDTDEQDASVEHDNKHCRTCSCTGTVSTQDAPDNILHGDKKDYRENLSTTCGHARLDDTSHDNHLPPPLPEPSYSVKRRILPSSLTPLNSPQGRQYLIDALVHQTAASYLSLTEHSCNQSDPAYCGITTLLVVLNALAVDPLIRWKGGWRYYGNEDMLLQTCLCMDRRRIERQGITLQEFQRLAVCQGLQVSMKQPIAAGDGGGGDGASKVDGCSLDDFRTDIIQALHEIQHVDDDTNSPTTTRVPPGILVVSFGRSALGQTGDGHFSPLAAYHAATDQVLILDVARFKYQHYWVKIDTLYRAMQLHDKLTQQPRGWYLLQAPLKSSLFYDLQSEDRRDVKFVPLAGQGHACPVHSIKVEYCGSGRNRPPS